MNASSVRRKSNGSGKGVESPKRYLMAHPGYRQKGRPGKDRVQRRDRDIGAIATPEGSEGEGPRLRATLAQRLE
jgi:hypothetical protein